VFLSQRVWSSKSVGIVSVFRNSAISSSRKQMPRSKKSASKQLADAMGDATNQRNTGSRYPLRPPPLITSFGKRFVARWTTNTAVNATCTFRNIADILNVGDSGGAQAWQVFNIAVRLHRVSVWGAVPISVLNVSTCSVDFGGINQGTVGPSARFTDTAIGTDAGPVVHAVPSMDSQAWQWQNSANNNTCFTITCGQGSVVELEYSGVTQETQGSAAITTAPVGIVGGRFYVRGPDGVALAASVFNTIGFNQD